MKVIVSEDAEVDLEEIGDWIARDSPGRAETFVEELRASCIGLAPMPYRFPKAGLRALPDLRKRVHGRYLILYQIDEGRQNIFVLRVVHGARNWKRTLVAGLRGDR